jgi:hypothetical protein
VRQVNSHFGNYIESTGEEAQSSRWFEDSEDLLTHIEESITMNEQVWHEANSQRIQHQLIADIRKELKPGYTVVRWDEQVCITYYPSGPDSRQRHFVKSYEEWQSLKVKLNY